jgi:hypothetical protein
MLVAQPAPWQVHYSQEMDMTAVDELPHWDRDLRNRAERLIEQFSEGEEF